MRSNPPDQPRSDLRFDLDIGELVLHGVDPHAVARVRADLERELAAKFAENGAALFGGGALSRGGALHLDQARIDLPAGTPSSAVGAAAARDLALRLASKSHGGEGGELSVPTDLGAAGRGKP